MEEIIIACAGGFGVEIFYALGKINLYEEKRTGKPKYKVLGFLSDEDVDLKAKNIDARILGTIRDWTVKGPEKYIVGLSMPAQKKKVAELLKKKGARFANVISPFAFVPPDLVTGEGCYISQASRIACGVRLGDFVNIHGSMFCGGAAAGNYCTTTGYSVIENASLGEGVFVGSKAVVTEGCTVGDWVRISAGSVVTGDVRPGVTVFGIPAQEIG